MTLTYEYFSFPFYGGHVTYILVIISLSILYSQAGFFYNGTANIRLDFPCRREFSYFEIDFVDLAFAWPGTYGCESIRQTERTEK